MIFLMTVVLFFCEVPVYSQKSTMNLESLIRESGMIFAGRVIDIETGTKDRMNLYMTRYTFEVLEPIYGVEGDTVDIKQYGGEANGKELYPAGVPRFERGEEVLVMLYPLSRIGMTSTVGKDQGKFWIREEDTSGTKVVFNKIKNRGLFNKLKNPGLVAEPEWIGGQRDSLAYDRFLETVRNLTAKLKDQLKR